MKNTTTGNNRSYISERYCWDVEPQFHLPSVSDLSKQPTRERRTTKKRFAVILSFLSPWMLKSSDRFLLNCSTVNPRGIQATLVIGSDSLKFEIESFGAWNLNQWRRRWRCRGRVQLTPAHRPRRICQSLRRVSTFSVLRGSTRTPMFSPSVLSTTRYDSLLSLSLSFWKMMEIGSLNFVNCDSLVLH